MAAARSLFALLSLIPLACCAAEPASTAAQSLQRLFDESWERDLRENPLNATYLGDHRYDGVLPDMTPAAIARREKQDLDTLQRLHGIGREGLTAQDQLSYDLFEHDYQARRAAQPFKPYLYAILSRDGLHTLSETAELIGFDSVKDYESWIARLRGTGAYIDQSIELLEIAMRERRTQPRAVLDRIAVPLASLAAATPEESAFYAPFKRMPESIPAAERKRLAAAGRAAVEQSVIPAYERLNEFFTKRFLPAGRATVGIWDTPDGDAFYRQQAAFHTTTSLAPQQIHEIGLKEVARIRAEMDAVIARIGFKGGFEAFVQFLRTDPRFYYGTPEELFSAYATTAKLIDPELVKLFGRLPRMPYGLRPIPATSAPNTTTAYYQEPALDGLRAGYYYVNLYRPEVRPKYEIEVLTVHEAVPGHHLQLALAMELEGLPTFRRKAGFTAFVEGWGLYSESLGEELGLYKDPYSKFGQLTYEMWRAVRLVVDTGMHYKHWTREAGHRLLQGQRRQDRGGYRERGRSLHRLARSGAGLQDRAAEDPGAAPAGAGEARREVRHPRFPRCGAGQWRCAAGYAGEDRERMGSPIARCAGTAIRLTRPVTEAALRARLALRGALEQDHFAAFVGAPPEFPEAQPRGHFDGGRVRRVDDAHAAWREPPCRRTISRAPASPRRRALARDTPAERARPLPALRRTWGSMPRWKCANPASPIRRAVARSSTTSRPYPKCDQCPTKRSRRDQASSSFSENAAGLSGSGGCDQIGR